MVRQQRETEQRLRVIEQDRDAVAAAAHAAQTQCAKLQHDTAAQKQQLQDMTAELSAVKASAAAKASELQKIQADMTEQRELLRAIGQLTGGGGAS